VLSTDPLVFARDANNELIIPLRKASGLEAIQILVRCAWLLWRDEYFLNRDVGMPWTETADGAVTERDAILGQPYNAAKLHGALRDEALKIVAVIDVTDMRSQFDGETRNVAVQGTVIAQFADQIVQGPVEIAAGA
jgi:hypothetical protein